MFEQELRLFAMQNGYLKMLVADLEDADLVKQPVAKMNTGHWILGHLAVCNDYTLAALGCDKVCPAAWWPAFDYGSQPGVTDNIGTTKSQLMDYIGRGHELIRVAIAKGVDAKKMAHPNEFESLRKALPTVGDFVAHLLTTHIAGHLGQLSAWRKTIGKGNVS